MLRRLPAPLLALLAVTALEGLAWLVAMPAFQGPDEGRHIAYVQKIADAHTIPWRSGHGRIPLSFPEWRKPSPLAGVSSTPLRCLWGVGRMVLD